MTHTETAPGTTTRRGFVSLLEPAGSGVLRAATLATLMLNVTLRCNLACAHCHHSCSPSRSEEMSRDTMLSALELARIAQPSLLDITGGEPALWPHLRELVSLAGEARLPVRVRTNLVALSRPEAVDLPALFASAGVSLLASLPGTTPEAVAEQRGAAAYESSIEVLRELASLGYGSDGSLVLDLAYNPPLGQLGEAESVVTERFRSALEPRGVRFDSLYSIANVPVGRYEQLLTAEDGLDAYLAGLAAAFNPDVASSLECRHGLVVGWDGTLSDCDFNLGASLGLAQGPRTLATALAALSGSDGPAALEALVKRRIAFAPHCYACTAGAGSG